MIDIKKDYYKIANRVAKKYRKYIDSEEMDSIINLSILQAIKSYETEKKYKISTLIGFRVFWNCCDFIRDETRYKKVPEEFKNLQSSCCEDNSSSVEAKDFYEKVINKLPKEDKEILEMYYVNDMTLMEMSKHNGYSHEWNRGRIKKIVERVKASV